MIGNFLSGDGGGDVGFALTGGDVVRISIHICVFTGEGGEFIFGSKLLLGVRVFSRGEEGVGGRDFAGGSLARER